MLFKITFGMFFSFMTGPFHMTSSSRERIDDDIAQNAYILGFLDQGRPCPHIQKSAECSGVLYKYDKWQ